MSQSDTAPADTPARAKGLGFGTKSAFGIGSLAEGIKSFSFEWFLLYYFTSVLGMSGTLAGTAMFIAMLFDAVTDPLAGSLSDNLRHKWGRRHPFMYASALPLAISFAVLFSPPAGLGEWGLFFWLIAGAVLVRGSMTLYHVPHLALGAELSNNYQERTGIVAYRVLFGIGGHILVATLSWKLFFTESAEFPEGQNNPAAYPEFAIFFGFIMLVTILLSGIGTHSRIPYLPPAPMNPERLSVGRVFGELVGALENRSFRFLFIGLVIFLVTRGVQSVLALHVLTYFWQVDAKAIQRTMVFAFAFGVPAWTIISRLIDKKPTLLVGILSFSIFNLIPPAGALLGVWPSPESSLYFSLLAVCMGIAAFGGAAGFVAAGSMLADVSDEHELTTRRRQEGIFFGALAFAGKSATGLGTFIAGIAIDVINFPAKPQPGQVIPQETLDALAIVYGPGIAILTIVSIPFFFRYRLNRERHAKILAELDARRAAEAE